MEGTASVRVRLTSSGQAELICQMATGILEVGDAVSLGYDGLVRKCGNTTSDFLVGYAVEKAVCSPGGSLLVWGEEVV